MPKMAIPNEALQKVSNQYHTRSRLTKNLIVPPMQLVQEIESQAISSQREINIVKTAVSSKQRDIRMLELTSTEVGQLVEGTKVYEGVGKM